MLQLRNKTPFAAQTLLLPDVEGNDTLYVIVKATFGLDPEVFVAPVQKPIVLADEYWGEPGQSSIKYASEVHPSKPGTDVVAIGEACAPDEKPVTEMGVGLSVAGRSVILQIFGDRDWERGAVFTRPGEPRPFVRMPLVYERAYGGEHVVDAKKGKVLREPRNPVGKGFLGKRGYESLKDVGVPNIEDYRYLIAKPEDRPMPMGFGYIAPNWQPRVAYIGTYDEAWQQNRSPVLPQDFDPRFFHAAHPELIFDHYFEGDEPVEIVNMSPRGRQSFVIPRCDVRMTVTIGEEDIEPPAYLETVLLEPTEESFCLVWRAAMPCDRNAFRMGRVSVTSIY